LKGRLRSSPGRCTNQENFRSCQRRGFFTLPVFTVKSTEKAHLYLLCNQRSAAHPQGFM